MEQIKQTAVEWLHIEFQKKFPKETSQMYNNNQLLYEDMIQQAKEMEKQQIMESYKDSTCQFSVDSRIDCPKSAEQYYNENYGKS